MTYVAPLPQTGKNSVHTRNLKPFTCGHMLLGLHRATASGTRNRCRRPGFHEKLATKILGSGIQMKARIAIAGALLAATGVAGAAEISATAPLANEYDWRGISQTQGDPAFQLGLNYSAESGMYMGIWGSNVKFANTADWETYGRRPSTELDVYLGYAFGDPEETIGWDLGAIYYSYPNAGEGNFP